MSDDDDPTTIVYVRVAYLGTYAIDVRERSGGAVEAVWKGIANGRMFTMRPVDEALRPTVGTPIHGKLARPYVVAVYTANTTKQLRGV